MKRSLMKRSLAFLALLPSLLFAQTFWDGTADTTWYTNNKYIITNEYTIYTAAELAGLAKLVNGAAGNGTYNMNNKTIKLGNDIILNDTTNWRDWATDDTGLEQWTAIGIPSNSFQGTFDGNGHVVSGVYINSTNTYAGLFGDIGYAGTIKNLGVVASYIKGDVHVGGLVGFNNGGTVNNSFATGNVEGSGSYTGGLVGYNSVDGYITNSYAVGRVQGFGGGLVGYNSSNNSIITNSYYDSQTSNKSDIGKGIPKPTEYMQSKDFADFLQIVASLQGFNSWEYSEGEYPKLRNEIAIYPEGDGTEANPYVIKIKRELEAFSLLVNSGMTFSGKYLKLGNDIVLNNTTNWQNWATDNTELEQWTPIGTSSKPFQGTFDGDGHVVSGVYINSTNNDAGLFGYLGIGGIIKNLGVADSYIKGGNNVGGLVGGSQGTITNSYATGNVEGNYYVGGLKGYSYSRDTITNSYATGNVSGDRYVGGLAGNCSGGDYNCAITNSYATGNVRGNQEIGGLVGSSGGTITNSYAIGNVEGIQAGGLVGYCARALGSNCAITNSYATGNVEGNEKVGGLVGYNSGAPIRNSYAVGRVQGNSDVGGLVGSSSGPTYTNSYYDLQTSGRNDTGKGTGLSTDDMKSISTYAIGNWDLDSTWAVNDGYPVLQYQLANIANMQRIGKSQAYLANQRQKTDTIPTIIEYHTGNPIEPQVDSVVFNTKLTQGTDYEVLYANNIDTGSTAKIIINGIGNFVGAKILDFYITGFRDISKATTPTIPEQLETGAAIEYKPVLKDYSGAVTLRENTDYILIYENNESIGRATIHIIGQGVYDGSEKTVTFNIVGAKQLTSSNTTVNLVGAQSYVYSGNKITPEVTVIYNPSTTLVKDTDYRVSYGDDNTNAGTGTVTITGIGNYAGTLPNKTFPITKKPLDNTMAAPVEPQIYTEYSIQPEVSLAYGGKLLVLGTDYTVRYLNNIYSSEQAVIKITGTGNYSDSINILFTISEGDIVRTPIAVVWQDSLELEYNGQNRCPSATAILPNTLPLNLSISCNAVNARTEPPYYVATATYPNTAYELLNSTIEFIITRAPIAPTLEIPSITADAALSKTVKGINENPSISYWYSVNRDSAYTQTTPTTEGVYYAYAIVSPTTNYQGSSTDTISFSIYKSNATPLQVNWNEPYSFVYNGTKQSPGASASHGGRSFPLLVNGATDAGQYTATAKFQTELTDYKLEGATKEFTITPRPLDEYAIEPISNSLYTGLQICPEITVKDGSKVLARGIDYEVSCGENLTQSGTMSATGIGNYSGTVSRPFFISSDGATIVSVVWDTERTFAYDGSEHVPAATTANKLELEIIGKQTDAGSHTAVAQMKKQNLNIILANASMPYTITPKTLEVSWTEESVFIYSKMPPPLRPSVTEPGVDLRLDAYVNVGKYAGMFAAIVEIKDQEKARNYNLTNRTKDYEIIKKDLKPYFTDTLPDFSTNKADTLWVPYNVFNDSAALHNALIKLIDYNGFATDTVSNESDNATVLKGTPEVTLQYIQTSPFMLSKRVETSQKATATIVTTEVSADNYALTRPNIVIMATVEEDETADKIFCRLGNNCAQFSAEVCSAISGQAVESCEIKVDCVINNVCIENTSLESCSAMSGEVVSSCAEVPTQRPALTANTFRIWQTASGVINVDLGYMPSAPVRLEVYDLKGNLVATERVNTRFANVRVGVPSGVYLFRTGNRILRAAIL